MDRLVTWLLDMSENVTNLFGSREPNPDDNWLSSKEATEAATGTDQESPLADNRKVRSSSFLNTILNIDLEGDEPYTLYIPPESLVTL
jgi:hypothetical protein